MEFTQSHTRTTAVAVQGIVTVILAAFFVFLMLDPSFTASNGRDYDMGTTMVQFNYSVFGWSLFWLLAAGSVFGSGLVLIGILIRRSIRAIHLTSSLCVLGVYLLVIPIWLNRLGGLGIIAVGMFSLFLAIYIASAYAVEALYHRSRQTTIIGSTRVG